MADENNEGLTDQYADSDSPERLAPQRWRRAPVAGWVVGVLILTAVIAPVFYWQDEILALLADRERLSVAVRQAGAWGPLLLVALTVAQVIAAPLPGQAINLVAGYLYGFWLGLLYSWFGSVLGSALAIVLARIAGRPLVNRLLKPSAVARLDRLAAGKGLRFFFLVFLIPFLPDDLACFLAGLTPLPLPALIITAAVGRLPGLLTAVWAGSQAELLGWQSWTVLAALVAIGVIVAWRYGDKIQEALLNFVGHRA